MIHISLSPNLEPDDVFLALRWLSSPFSWTGKKNQEKLKESLQQLFPQTQAIFLFNAGRSALMLGLKALNLPPGSKILLQAFTCSTVPNAILWNSLTPEYLDIQKEDFNLNPDILPQNPVAKALIVQHTFGQPANMEKITTYCQKKKLYLIEDGAHSLGATYREKKIGSFGDITMLSFGRDKIISSVFGGALLVNNKNLVKPVENLYQSLPYPSFSWTAQQLLHPPITFLSKKTYSFYLGKLILFLSQKTKLISKAIYPKERDQQTPPFFPRRLPEPLASLANHQLQKLTRFNRQRQKNAFYYQENLRQSKITKPLWNPEGIYLRYPILLEKPEKLKLYLKKHGVIIGKHWYPQPITPANNLSLLNYQKGQCPIAEETCRQCLNLPTHPTITTKEVKYITKLINQWSA